MVESGIFHYHFRASFLHRLDVRIKLISLIMLTLSLLKSDFTALFSITIITAAFFIYLDISFISLFKTLRYFLVLLLFVLIARTFSVPGVPLFSETGFFTMTREGLYEGFLICWRLLSVVLMGVLLTDTTRTSEIRAAVAWFFKPFPLIPHTRIATMLSLMIRFIPVILDQAKEISDAQRARGIEMRKNPVYRFVRFAIPLMRRVFEQADELVLAMEARCYSENRTEPVLSSDKKDWLVLAGVTGICAGMIYF